MASHPSQFSRGKFCNAETDAYYIRCGRVDGARVFKNASHKVLLDGPIIADIASVDFWGGILVRMISTFVQSLMNVCFSFLSETVVRIQ